MTAATQAALTDAQINELARDYDECKTYSDILGFARAIERAAIASVEAQPAEEPLTWATLQQEAWEKAKTAANRYPNDFVRGAQWMARRLTK